MRHADVSRAPTFFPSTVLTVCVLQFLALDLASLLSDTMGKYSHASPTEEALMKKLHAEGMGLRKIRSPTGRGFETISKHVFTKSHAKKVRAKGRPSVITPSVYKRLVAANEKLLSAKPRKEVTVKQVRDKIGFSLQRSHRVECFPQQRGLLPSDVREARDHQRGQAFAQGVC